MPGGLDCKRSPGVGGTAKEEEGPHMAKTTIWLQVSFLLVYSECSFTSTGAEPLRDYCAEVPGSLQSQDLNLGRDLVARLSLYLSTSLLPVYRLLGSGYCSLST